MPSTSNEIPKGWVKVTRVYVVQKEDETEEIKTQPYMLQVSKIESFRPRNSIGTKQNGNRCTITTDSGKYINVKEKFSEMQRLLAQAAG